MSIISYCSKCILHAFVFSDAVKDDEIETWAAKTIQHSFKQYKKKTLSQEATET